MKKDLTQGDISKALLVVASPVILSSLIQTAYNLTDMFWIGKLGSDAVSAVGTAGFWMWLQMGFIMLFKNGTGIKIAHSTGEKNHEAVKHYFRTGLQTMLVGSIIYSIFIYIFRYEAIAIFGLTSDYIMENGASYLAIISIGMIFLSLNNIYSAAFQAMGNSVIPLIFSGVGLTLNMILDPVLILYFDLGATGAAIASTIGMFTVFVILNIYTLLKTDLFDGIKWLQVDFAKIKEVISLSWAPAAQSIFFTFISMVIARMVTNFGSEAYAAQKVGTQIEAITWMTAGGIQIALSSFVGQNFGAKQYHRLLNGYGKALKYMTFYGILVTVLLYFGAESIMRIFFDSNEEETIAIGIRYLQILSISQLGMIFEITTVGAFFGLGRPNPPSFIALVFNVMRIPMAMWLSSIMGIEGIWWAISLSSIFKGIFSILWFSYIVTKDDNLNLRYILH